MSPALHRRTPATVAAQPVRIRQAHGGARLVPRRAATSAGSSSSCKTPGTALLFPLGLQSWKHSVAQRPSLPTSTRALASARKGHLEVRACGIIGIFKWDGPVNAELYEGLMMLQHRGQDSAGMVTADDDGRGRWSFKDLRANGLVRDVFNASTMKNLTGSVGIGHVRYPTAGGLNAAEAQPFFVNSPFGIMLIHNGNITNTSELRELVQLQDDISYRRHLRTDSDSEILLNVFADEIHRAHKMRPTDTDNDLVFQAVCEVMNRVSGAFSVITLIDGVGLLAFRDPNGIRPLVLGKRPSMHGDEWAVASEGCAFGPLGFEFVRDIAPGEAVLINQKGQCISRQCAEPNLTPCIFEYIYLARPDSVINGISVYNMQLSLGKRLAKKITERGWDIDICVPVPDGSRPAAIEISHELRIPYREGLVKNRYVGRTFLMPDQRIRELSVRRKLNAMESVLKGQKILLIDDSIVRGTTMRQIVDMCRRAGAAKVYLASAAPPVRYPNVYGVDLPSRKEMVAYDCTEDEVRNLLGADGLIYQTVEDLEAAGLELNPEIQRFDMSVFDGIYVTKDIDEMYLDDLQMGRGKGRDQTGRLPPKVAAGNF